jgi:hypothetical protein
MVSMRQRRELVAMIVLIVAVFLLLLAIHGSSGHGPMWVEFLLLPVFLFGLVLVLGPAPVGCWSEARLPNAPVRHSLRQRPPPLV